jgi:hypothetical protein
LELDKKVDVANCSVTSYFFDPAAGKHGKLCLEQAYYVASMENEGIEITNKQERPKTE